MPVSPPAAPPQGPAAVLVVCTGNICRSPYAERVVGHALDPDTVQVTSAGTGALVDGEIDAEALALLAARGVRHDGHRARQLSPQIVAGADLVLTMTTEHRTAVVRLLPRAVRVTFTVQEVARLLPAVDPAELPPGPADRVRALPRLLAAARGQRPRGAGSDDVADPYRRGAAAFRAMADELDPALEVLVEALRGPRPSASP